MKELSGFIQDNSIEGITGEIQSIEGLNKTTSVVQTIDTNIDTISGRIQKQQNFSGEIQEEEKIQSIVVDEKYNGQIDIEDKKSGELKDLSKINGKIEIENSKYGKIKCPKQYDGWIDTIDDVSGKIVLPDITDIEALKQLQLIVNRLVTEVEGNSELAIDGLIYNVYILQQQYSELVGIYYDTVENWNNQPDRIAKKGDIYIYLDAPQAYGGTGPRIKIGNGGYLIDLMFVDQNYFDHLQNNIIHITQEERENWNDKVGVTVVQDNGNQLLFYRDKREVNINGE